MNFLFLFNYKMNFNNQCLETGPLSSYDIKTSKEDELYRLALYNNNTDFIEEFNFTVNSIIPGILKRKFQCKDCIRDVKSVRIKFPQFTSGNNNYLLTPFICRMTCSSYMCEIWIDYKEGPLNNEMNLKNNLLTCKLGFFHCVVGSNRDITNIKPDEFENLDEWKMMLGECPGSPASYILNKGNEKIIIIDEKLRTNILMTFKTKKDIPVIETRITCMNNSITTLVRIKIGKKRPTIKVVFPHLKNKHYPLFLTFYVLFYSYNGRNPVSFNLDKIKNLIANFVSENERDRIIAYLSPSEEKFKTLFCKEDNGSLSIDELAVRNYVNKKLKNTADNQFTMDNLKRNVFDELFIQCDSHKDKICNLANMACQTIRCVIGTRNFDSRDEWGKKKGDTYCRMISQYANELVDHIKNKTRDENGLNLNKSDRKESIVEARKCDTINAANAEKDKITNGVDSRSTSIVIRSVSEGQLNYIDPAHTPESSSCGLNKYKASLCHLSFNQEYIPNRKLAIDDLLEPYIYYFSEEKSQTYFYKLITINNDGIPFETTHLITNDVKTEIFFSQRILTIFTEYFENETAVYNIEDDLLIIKFLNENNYDYVGYDSIYTSGKLITYIPVDLKDKFYTVTQKTKNPDYLMCSSFDKNEDCTMKLLFKFDSDKFYFETEENYSLYVSKYFVELLNKFSKGTCKSSIKKIDGEDVCVLKFSGEINLTQKVFSHWSGIKFKSFFPTFKNNFEKLFKTLLCVINEYFSLEKSKTFNFNFTFNGIVLTDNRQDFYPCVIWNNGKKLHSYLKNKRGNGELAFDSCIYYNEIDFSIQYFDDPGRLMAPMLVIDNNGELVIDKENLWDDFEKVNYKQSKAIINNLYRKGALQLIDVKEMDSTLISEDINECRTVFKLKEFLNNIDIENIKSSILHCKNNDNEVDYYHNEDISSIKILGNTFEIEFTTNQNENTLSFEQDGIVYYATYVIRKKIYTKSKEKIYKIERSTNGLVKDTFYIAYKKNDQIMFITEDNDLETDGEYVYEDNGDRYEVNFIDFKGKDEIYINDSFCIVEPQFFQRTVEQANNIVYIYNGQVIQEDELIDKNFIRVFEDDKEKFKIVDEIHFPENEYACFFDSQYVNIHEYINSSNKDYNKFNFQEENKQDLDIRECNLYLSMIRRHIDDIQKIEFLDYLCNLETQFEILKKLRENISYFGNKKIINIIRRYLSTEFKFTHCLIDPGSAYSVVANFVPKADSNPGPRYSYQCSMATQALGVGNCVWYRRYETSIKRLIAPTEHLFETVAELPLNQVTMPVTQNLNVLVAANYKGFEDPIILTKEALEIIGRYEKESVIKINESTQNKDFTERICFPFDKIGNLKNGYIYRHLDENGYPRLGSRIKIGDCIVGRNKIYNLNGEIKRKDSSFIAGIDNEGIVTSIQIIGSEGTSSLFKTIFIKLSQRRKQQVGDKMAARYSQKGTIGDIIGGMINYGDFRLKIVDDCLMPYVIGGPNDRMRAEIIFNPASFPSRMTCGLIKEILCSKAGLYLQEKVDASNFHHLDMDYYRNALYSNKLFKENEHLDINSNEFMCHSDGEIMMDYSTGKPMKFFVGVVAYQFLKHHVEDKKTARATGSVKSITHQPEEGRSVAGGLRFGEMERDALLSSGASRSLYDRFFLSSDGYTDVFCSKCKNNSSISILNDKTCKICGFSGCLVSVENTRISVVFNHQMNAVGLEIKETLLPEES